MELKKIYESTNKTLVTSEIPAICEGTYETRKLAKELFPLDKR
jgi:hypothetical protein